MFSTCKNLLRTLPQLRHDGENPNDVASTPHELTHAPDALRYFVAGRPCPARPAGPDTRERLGRKLQKLC